MCCVLDPISSKTLCRIFAGFNVFWGILAIFYWQMFDAFYQRIGYSSKWNHILSLNEPVKATLAKNCGQDYLSSVTPDELGKLFKTSTDVYLTAFIVYIVKGFIQFFTTCFSPYLAYLASVTLIIVDLNCSALLVYGLCVFRDPKLCMLEHTDIFNYPGQQTQMTVITAVFLMFLKPPELLSIVLFICAQSRLISLGERRSKGARRSEAFRTPLHSRVNSYITCFDASNNRSPMIRKKKELCKGVNVQPVGSSDEDPLRAGQLSDNMCKFIELDNMNVDAKTSEVSDVRESASVVVAQLNALRNALSMRLGSTRRDHFERGNV